MTTVHHPRPPRRVPGHAAALLLALLAPGAVSAQTIRNTAHDLSASSGATVRSTDAELCKFCHTPHGSNGRVLWNHAPSAWAGGYTWGGQTATVAGTPLPTTVKPSSKVCLGCHDGTVAIGELSNAGGGPGVVPVPDVAVPNHTVTGGKMVTGNVNLVGAGGSLAGSHPVSIPYAGQTGYNGINSAVPPSSVDNTVGSYFTTTTAGCTNVTGICTTATGAGTNGPAIQLYDEVPGTRANLGIECNTCHEVHNRYGFAWFLRADAATSDGLCRSCHNK